LYKTIMDTVTRNKQGIDPIKPYLAKIEAIKNKEDLQQYLTEMQLYGGGGVFSFGVRADAKDSNMNAAYLYPRGLGLPDRDYYVPSDSESQETRQLYKEHVARMLPFPGATPEEAAETAETILAFETKMASPRFDKLERRDGRLSYNP